MHKKFRLISMIGCSSLFTLKTINSQGYCEGEEGDRNNQDNNNSQKKIVVVKYGGSAITMKKQFEQVNLNSLKKTVDQISEIVNRSNSPRFIIIHGAGSFGHFQAHQYNLRSGGGKDWRLGLSKTRESVLKLNNIILSEHCKRNLPCISVSLFPTVIMDQKKMISSGSLPSLINLMEDGLIPITHGDVLLDQTNNCVVYSGDRILEWLVNDLSSKYPNKVIGVFLTDVAGLYDRPPDQTNSSTTAKLIPQIYVTPSGKVLTPLDVPSSTSVLSHDVTGGISSKIQTAIRLVKETGIEIFLVQAGTIHATRALSGEVTGDTDEDYRNREDWIGTRISLWREGGEMKGR